MTSASVRKRLPSHLKSERPGFGLEPRSGAEPSGFESTAASIEVGLTPSASMAVDVLGHGIEGRPARASNSRQVLADSTLEEFKQLRADVASSLVLTIRSIWVKGLVVKLELASAWVVVGEAVDPLTEIGVEPLRQTQNFLSLGHLGRNVALVDDRNAASS